MCYFHCYLVLFISMRWIFFFFVVSIASSMWVGEYNNNNVCSNYVIAKTLIMFFADFLASQKFIMTLHMMWNKKKIQFQFHVYFACTFSVHAKLNITFIIYVYCVRHFHYLVCFCYFVVALLSSRFSSFSIIISIKVFFLLTHGNTTFAFYINKIWQRKWMNLHLL